jgi:hypothetical protein
LLLLTVRAFRPRLCMFPPCIEGLNGFASASDLRGSSLRLILRAQIHSTSVIPRPMQSHAFRCCQQRCLRLRSKIRVCIHRAAARCANAQPDGTARLLPGSSHKMISLRISFTAFRSRRLTSQDDRVLFDLGSPARTGPSSPTARRFSQEKPRRALDPCGSPSGTALDFGQDACPNRIRFIQRTEATTSRLTLQVLRLHCPVLPG